MALDSKQKRGSAMQMTMPQREWLAEPSGSLPVGSRITLLKLCSAVPPAAPPSFVVYWAGRTTHIAGVAGGA